MKNVNLSFDEGTNSGNDKHKLLHWFVEEGRDVGHSCNVVYFKPLKLTFYTLKKPANPPKWHHFLDNYVNKELWY